MVPRGHGVAIAGALREHGFAAMTSDGESGEQPAMLSYIAGPRHAVQDIISRPPEPSGGILCAPHGFG